MKIITLNLRHDADRWQERFPLVVEELLRESPEVIALQEVALDIDQAHLIAGRLNESREGEPYAVVVESKWGEAQREGIAILTSLSVIEQERLDLPVGGRVALRVRVAGERPVDVVTTHLHHLPKDDESIRLPQMEQLLAWMFRDSEVGACRILCGDLNAVETSETVARAKSRLTSAYFEVHQSEPASTFPTPLVVEEGEWFEPRAIDYIFFDPRCLRVEESRLAFTEPHPEDSHLLPSDHYGLMATFSLRDTL